MTAPLSRCSLVLFAGLVAVSEGAAEPSMKELRREAADRRRRIIYNNDGAEPVMRLTRPSAEDFLDVRTTALAGTSVDTLFYCSRSSGFGLFTHLTKVGEVFTTTEGRYANNQMAAFARAGIDPLRVVVEFCRKNRIEIFWSMRMNDNHDSSKVYGDLIFRANPLKNKHPEYLMGTVDRKPKYGAWTAVNYGLPEVRELAFRYFEEVCRNYDVDGVELDFFRHIVYFKSTTRGEVATDGERAAMTDLVRRIRTMADDVGRTRGRPILVAVRAPDSVEYARDVGLDLQRWMKEDLIDLYMPAGTFQLNEWKPSIELGHAYGVKVYPSLDESRSKDPNVPKPRMTDRAYRARAAEVWGSGAEGVYLYNFGDYPKGGDKPFPNELGDAAALAKMDKDYFACVRGLRNTTGGTLPYEPYVKFETLHPDMPKTVTGDKPTVARMQIHESAVKATYKLRLQFKSPVKADAMGASFNDQPLKDAAVNGNWLEFAIEPTAIRKGENRVTLSNNRNAKVIWTDAILEVRMPGR